MCAPDLGIDRGSVSCGKPRGRKRKEDAFRQAGRALKFGRVGRFGRSVAKTLICRGAIPTFSYSDAVYGSPPSAVLKWRRTLGKAIAPRLNGRCLDTLLMLEAGQGDPVFSSFFRLLGSWTEIISGSALRRRKALQLWPNLLSRIQTCDANRRWRKCSGTTAAIICSLLQIGWAPDGPWTWRCPAGKLFTTTEALLDTGELDWSDLREALAQSIQSMLCLRADKHYLGKGFNQGVDLHHTKKYLARLQRTGKIDKHGAALALATAAVWPRSIIFDVGFPVDTTCQRCGSGIETQTHRMWTCPCNSTIPGCKNSEPLVRRAIRSLEHEDGAETLWLRGLVPSSWTSVPAPPSVPLRWAFGPEPGATFMTHGVLYGAGDGSGGPFSRDKRFRRAAWSCVLICCEDGPNSRNPDSFRLDHACAGGSLENKRSTELRRRL